MRLERAKTWTEIGKNVAEVIALIVAGWWAYDHFWKTEAPGLGERFVVSSEIKFFPAPTPDSCLVAFQVRAKNIGKVDVDITRAALRVWVVPFPTLDRKSRPAFINLERLIKGAKLSREIEVGEHSILGLYRGDVQFTDDYVFALTKEPGSVVVFTLEMYAGDRLAANDYRWDFVCDEESAVSKGTRRGTK